ncbi:LysR family transcriptional regulator [Pseudoflavonifractor sp. BIOML-A6]|nr:MULTISPECIES: LysR family transcriptional regulator [unclassified Pseudoflavonifractor]MTQ96918.1 LysR family transcriptional regulator [Pseudoflavonifractor sp. BIOML-A16]MTR04988.1 LysR family transcriptional regulator [Pseudoflavonifractor sp. BIOML-A15]MTR30764.1 LysR family transcriptional regulator [Pseudoflavonifractor sp. BIOML-A14]MTR72003.1 LysR family transcriptional regulator [Pseudoflavonifractor sp. BIOML-A18]MTS63527.1 LysR family transcriptional regulator [Pseudoflavonifract
MEVRVLRYFLAVAREESISGAADSLHLTQPTLSRQLMDLEAELGRKLLIRGSRKVTLTEEGVLLRKRAEEILDLMEKTRSELCETDEADITGDIYIGGGETDAMRLIARTAKELQAAYPRIRYHLYSGNGEDVSERLDKGLLDLGILVEPFDMKKYDSIQLPATDIWGVLMRKDSPLAEKEYIQPEDLWELPLLTSRQTMAQKELMAWLGREHEELHIVSTYNLIYNASLMVEEGLGYALSLDKLINTTGDSALCFRPLRPKLEVGLDIVWKKYQVFSPATAKFLERLQAKFPHA